ncbi:hypothetical protein TI39_contig347g00002 [Zymoseptoria brevis]|uniref:Uncharacterized protein n=1 Tax=Zymoseptoria brevis TaxID=1047168 RepID=A0A0F4GRT0_9PEZI|nr:hypothetical protein TI39_contig347g00002 [Zymoseptoria brevis]
MANVSSADESQSLNRQKKGRQGGKAARNGVRSASCIREKRVLLEDPQQQSLFTFFLHLTPPFHFVIKEAQKHAEKVRGTWQGLDGMDIDDLQVELFLTIPDMWKPPANRYMTSGAEMAGVLSVQLTMESLCAAAYFMHDVHKSTRRSLNPGEAILVVDACGGTTDVTRFEMPASGNAGAMTGLRRTGVAKGGLAGSYWINDGISKWLILEADTNLGGFTAWVAWLGYGGAPYAGFYRAANEAFDKAKLDFLPGVAYSGAHINIIVPGSPTSDATMNRTWHVVLPCAKMRELFDKVIDDNYELIAPMITPNTRAMVMPGGFADSQYYRSRLQALLEPAHPGLKIDDGDTLLLTRHQSVATGALLRYNAAWSQTHAAQFERDHGIIKRVDACEEMSQPKSKPLRLRTSFKASGPYRQSRHLSGGEQHAAATASRNPSINFINTALLSTAAALLLQDFML